MSFIPRWLQYLDWFRQFFNKIIWYKKWFIIVKINNKRKLLLYKDQWKLLIYRLQKWSIKNIWKWQSDPIIRLFNKRNKLHWFNKRFFNIWFKMETKSSMSLWFKKDESLNQLAKCKNIFRKCKLLLHWPDIIFTWKLIRTSTLI